MSNNAIYTAVGRWEKQSEADETVIPVIILRGREYQIDQQELLLWCCLNWRLLQKAEIGAQYEKLAATAGFRSHRTWQQCLDRLVLRGLVVVGQGETDYDALYDLLAPLNIIPIGGGVFARLLSFVKLTIWDNVSPAIASRVIHIDHRTQNEKQVMRLVSQTMLSVAEVVRCVERSIQSIASTDAVVAQLYDDEDTTSLNLPANAKFDSCCSDVITAVANLYVRQQIIFDCV